MDLVDIDKVLDDLELNEDNNEFNNKPANIVQNNTTNVNNKEALSAKNLNYVKQNEGKRDEPHQNDIFANF